MWSHDFLWKYFPVCDFLLDTSTSTEAIKLKFGYDKFGEKTVNHLKAAIRFQKKPRDQVDKIIDQLNLSMRIPNVSLKFISWKETCK